MRARRELNVQLDWLNKNREVWLSDPNKAILFKRREELWDTLASSRANLEREIAYSLSLTSIGLERLIELYNLPEEK